jgi:PAS domain S-box-containing protein
MADQASPRVGREGAELEGAAGTAAGTPSELSYAELIDGLDAIVWEMDARTWQFTFVSRRAEDLLGYPAHRWIDEPGFWSDMLLHPDDRAWALDFCTAATRDARDHDFDYRAVAADGRTVYLRDLVRVIRGEDGSAELLRGVMIDVTAQKLAEAEIRERERHAALATRVSSAMSSALPLGEALRSCTDAMVEHLDATFARIWVLDRADQTLVLRASSGLYTHLDGPHGRVPVGKFKIGRIAAERRPHLTNDVQNDPRIGDPEWARREGMVAFAGYPLIIDDALVGVLAMFARTRLSDATLEALGAVAERVATIVERRQAERTLADRERQLSIAQDLARLGSWSWEVGADRVIWSDTLYGIFGIDPGTPVDFDSYLERIHPDDRELVSRTVETAMRTGERYRLEHRVVRPDGGIRHVFSEGEVEAAEDGRPRRFVGIAQDVTERREAAEREHRLDLESVARREAETAQRRVQNILESITDAFFALDDEWRFSYMNAAAERLLDRPASTLLGNSVWEEFPEAVGSTFETMYRRAVGARETVEFREFFPPLETWFEVRAFPSELGLSVYFRNVNERVRMEERQRFLVEAGTLLAGSLDYQTTLASVARLAVPMLADWCAVDLLEDDGGVRRVEVAHQDPSKIELAHELEREYPADPDAPSGVHNVLRTGEPEIMYEIPEELLHESARDERHLQILRDLGLRSALIVPLIARGRTLGAITLVHAESGRLYSDDDLEFTRELAIRAALAVDNARLIGELERTLSDLREREAHFRFLAEAIPVQVWTARPDGMLDFVTDRVARYFGTSSEQVLEDGWKNVVHRDDLETALDRWVHSLATGEAYEVEFRLREAESDSYRWHIARAVALRDETGRITKWFGTNTDIEDWKRNDALRERLMRELGAERQRLHDLVMEAPAAICIQHGPDHRYQLVNDRYRRMTGGRDLDGLPVREALPDMEGRGLFELLDRVYQSGEAFTGTEMPAEYDRAGDGRTERAFFNVVYQPIRDADGRVEGILTHAVEVTDQVHARREVERKAEELAQLAAALERSNRELDQFAYVTSHDLKAPLRGIANLAQWIEEDFPGEVSAEVKDHLDLLKGRVHRMEGLIDGILQYSRAGRVQGEVEEVETGALAAEIVDLLDPPETIAVEISPDLPTLRTERLPLQQVLMNLVGNAVKYSSGTGSRVRIDASPSDGGWEFSVSDDGPGIAPRYHDRIFGIFQTLEARDRVEGTGIGLSLVKKIVEQRGGRIRVESAEGAGATFRFTWPG